jgi:RNA polymerase sigma factor (sigma-70 family)
MAAHRDSSVVRSDRPAPDDRLDEPSNSFEIFYEVEHDRLFRALYLVCGSRAEAEDLMQDAFLAVWERWEKVERMQSPTGYLYRTAMNARRMRYRRSVIAARRVISPPLRVDAFEELETREDVRAALAAVPRQRRAALVLTDLLGFEPEEAARVLGVRASTIRGAATKARAQLRSSIDGSQRGVS